MPRKSANDRLQPVQITAAPSLAPRPETPESVANAFREIVRSVSPGHFKPCDSPMVEELARSIVICRESGKRLVEDGLMHGGEIHPLVKVLQKERQLAAMLSRSLRLTPQSRVSKERAGTTSSGGAPSFDFRGL